jgi:hypothetical protein
MVNIRHVDPLLHPTDDIIVGWPVVDVLIDIGFSRAGLAPDADVQPNFQKFIALIDTGAQATFIDTTIARGQSKRRETSENFRNIRVGEVYDALMVIPGLDNPFVLEIGTTSIVTAEKRIPIVIGRDVLKQYKLVYDPPNRDYRLERP